MGVPLLFGLSRAEFEQPFGIFNRRHNAANCAPANTQSTRTVHARRLMSRTGQIWPIKPRTLSLAGRGRLIEAGPTNKGDPKNGLPCGPSRGAQRACVVAARRVWRVLSQSSGGRRKTVLRRTALCLVILTHWTHTEAPTGRPLQSTGAARRHTHTLRRTLGRKLTRLEGCSLAQLARKTIAAVEQSSAARQAKSANNNNTPTTSPLDCSTRAPNAFSLLSAATEAASEAAAKRYTGSKLAEPKPSHAARHSHSQSPPAALPFVIRRPPLAVGRSLATARNWPLLATGHTTPHSRRNADILRPRLAAAGRDTWRRPSAPLQS